MVQGILASGWRRRLLQTGCALLLLATGGAAMAAAQSSLRLPLYFEARDNGRYAAHGTGYRLDLSATQQRYTLDPPDAGGRPLRLRTRLLGADAQASVQMPPPLAGRINRISGNDPAHWRTGVPTYARVGYNGVYPGIDIAYYGRDHELEYDFIVAPGADPASIRLAFDGPRQLRVDAAGDLLLQLRDGVLTHRKPVAYQDIGGRRVDVPARWRIDGLQARFELEAYDHSSTLVIDPVLSYASYLGLGEEGSADAVAVGPDNRVYIAGRGYAEASKNYNLIIMADESGSLTATSFRQQREAIVNLIETYADIGADVTVGVAYFSHLSRIVVPLTHDVEAATAAVSASMQRGGNTNYEAALSLSRQMLEQATTDNPGYETAFYFISDGLPNGDAGLQTIPFEQPDWAEFLQAAGITSRAIGVGDQANIPQSQTNLAWITNHPDGPILIAEFDELLIELEALAPTIDAFVARLTPARDGYDYITYLGGNGAEYTGGLAVDADGRAWLAGQTSSLNLPTVNPLQSTHRGGSYDAFIARFDAEGVPVFSSYYGGSGNDDVAGLALDADGRAWFAGTTQSTDLATVSPQQAASGGGSDAYIGRITGNTLTYASYHGGTGEDYAAGVAVDADGKATLAGTSAPRTSTLLADLPQLNPLQPAYGGGTADGFLARFEPSGALEYSSYLGGAGREIVTGVAVDANGRGHVSGYANEGFPTTPGAYRESYAGDAGSWDAFVARIGRDADAVEYATYLGGSGSDWNPKIAVDAAGNAWVGGYTTSLDFPLRDALQEDHGGGGNDGYVARLNADGSALDLGSYFGGADEDRIQGIAIDADGGVLVVGQTLSADLPTAAPFVDRLRGGSDGFVAQVPPPLFPGALALSAASYRVDEDAGRVTLTLRRSGGSDGEVAVRLRSADGSAVAGTDYTVADSEVTWADGDADDKILRIDIIDNTRFEPDRDFTVTLSAPQGGATLGATDEAQITIVNDDAPQPGTLALSAASYSVNEAAGSLIITVARSGGSDGVVSVAYATENDSAMAPADFAARSNRLSWADGDAAPKTFSVEIVDDAAFEGEEHFGIVLSEPYGGAVLGLAEASVAITDNDDPQPGVLQFSAASASVGENGGSVTLSVSRSGGSDGMVMIDYASADSSAAAGADYTATQGTLVWNPGDADTRTISVPVLDDAIYEGDESFVVQLSNPQGGAQLGARAAATVTIVENDLPQPGRLQFSMSAYGVVEGEARATIAVTRSGGTDGVVDVRYATGDGTATAGADYTAASGRLQWASGDGEPQRFTVAIADDDIYEGDETLSLSLTQPGGGATLGNPASATLTIGDNDLPPVPGTLQFAMSAYEADENGGAATITVTRAGGSDGAVSVRYASADGTANAGEDYAAVSGVLRWADGDAAAKSFVVNLLDDALLEGPETVNLQLNDEAGGATLGLAAATLTLVDDERPVPGTLQFTLDAMNVDEAAGSVTVTVTRNGGGDGAVSIDYASADGTASAGAAYEAVSGTLRWADGERGARTLTLRILDGSDYTGDQTFFVRLSTPGGGAALGAISELAVTVIENDPEPLETVTATGGGGAMGGWALAGLAGLALLRLRRRSLALLALLCFSAGATAAEAGDSRWYTGVGGGAARFGMGEGELAQRLAAQGYQVTPQIDDADPLWSVYAGYQFHPQASLELAYISLGGMQVRLQGNQPADLHALLRDTAENLEGYGDALSLSLRYQYPLGAGVFLAPRIGIYGWLTETTVEVGSERYEHDARGIGLLVAPGVNLQLGRNLVLRVEAGLYRSTTDARIAQVGGALEWRY